MLKEHRVCPILSVTLFKIIRWMTYA